MIEEILDAFGICTGGAEGFEADDVIGTLAAQERRDPVIVASGDRDLLQVVRDEPVQIRVLYLGRGLTNATLMGPAGSLSATACPPTGPAQATRSWRCCVATHPTGCPVYPVSARKPPRHCWRSTAR